MALNFPNNPNNGDVFTSDTKSWIYNSSKGIWISSTTGIGVIDDDTMLTASSDKLSTSESIKQYVDEHTHDEHILVINDDDSGYEISPRGLITQWGTLTPTAKTTNVVLPIAFTTKCLNIQTSIGADFNDTPTTDNSLIWGGYPSTTAGEELSTIKIMSDLKLSDSVRTHRRIYWQAIGY